MIQRFMLITLGIMLGIFAGCSNERSQSQGQQGEAGKTEAAADDAPEQEQGTIALSVLTLTNPFFKEIADAMEEEAASHGYEVIVTSGEFDVSKQQNQVKDFIVRQVDAIVLTPCDSKAIGPAIKEANDAGIPVFTADIAATAEGAEVVSHIATDNYSGGRQAADAIIEALDGNGKVAILDHPEVESVMLRTKGFQEKIAEENKKEDVDVEIIEKLPGGGAREKSFSATEDMLQAHPDLDAIFAINDPSALGARAALEKAGKADQVIIVGFDGQPEGKKAILQGKIYADPIQFPRRIGKRTVETIMKHFRGEEVQDEILIPTELYRQQDAQNDPALEQTG